MKKNLIAMGCGFLFAIGLGLSGMTQPSKVLAFLDITGNWDPSLIFVMVGAISVHSAAYFLSKRKVATKTEITPALVIGAALFGIGWGLLGFCPGPLLVSLVTFKLQAWVFFVSLLVGMGIFKYETRYIS